MTGAADTPAGAELPTCVVYGNCQASALIWLLSEAGALGATHRVARLPAVHEITAANLDGVHAELRRADVVITQRVRDDYHGLPVGSEQMLAHAPATARVVSFPALYYDAFLPFQVSLREADGVGANIAPITTYHDLRHLHVAALGLGLDAARSWLRGYEPDAAQVRAFADAADQRLDEHQATLDARIPVGADGRAFGPDAFHAVNHPSLATLRTVRDAILGALGVPAGELLEVNELLGVIRTPQVPAVLRALGQPASEPEADWVVEGVTHPSGTVLEAHLAHYAKDPALVAAACETHATRMRLLGLSA